MTWVVTTGGLQCNVTCDGSLLVIICNLCYKECIWSPSGCNSNLKSPVYIAVKSRNEAEISEL